MKNVIIALVLGVLMGACTVTEDIEFLKLDNVQFGGIKDGKLTLTSDALFMNPNDYSVKIKSIDCDVFIDDNKVSELHQILATKMPSNSEFSLPIEIDIPAVELQKNLEGIFTGLFTQKKAILKMEGVLKVDIAGVTIPVSFNYEEEKGLNL